MRKIEVATDSVPEFELDTVADIQQRRQEREARQREKAQQQQQREEETWREETRAEESNLHEEGLAEKRPRTEKSDTETEAVRERGYHHSRNTIRSTQPTSISLILTRRLLWSL